MQTDIESALIGINHLAERLGLSRRTIQRILAKGDLPSLQIGRRRLVRLSSCTDGLMAVGHNRHVRTLRKPPKAGAGKCSRTEAEQTAQKPLRINPLRLFQTWRRSPPLYSR